MREPPVAGHRLGQVAMDRPCNGPKDMQLLPENCKACGMQKMQERGISCTALSVLGRAERVELEQSKPASPLWGTRVAHARHALQAQQGWDKGPSSAPRLSLSFRRPNMQQFASTPFIGSTQPLRACPSNRAGELALRSAQ